jgi:hypothetical protein
VLDVQDAAGVRQVLVLAVRHEVDVGTATTPTTSEVMPDAAPVSASQPVYTASDAQPELAEVIDLEDHAPGRIWCATTGPY